MSVEFSVAPKMSPLALMVGLRLSLAAASCRYAFGFDQSHTVMTALRSTPCGRCGFDVGSSPAATRSVQSPSMRSAACVPIRSVLVTIWVEAWPDWMRRVQASWPLENLPSAAGMVRVALLPSWWQPTQPLVLMISRNWLWLLTFGLMPLPVGPVPGKVAWSGTLIIEYQ